MDRKLKVFNYYLIVNINLDYLKKTMYNLFTENIQEFCKTNPLKLLNKILEK